MPTGVAYYLLLIILSDCRLSSSLTATAFAQIAGSRKQPRLHSYDIKAVYPHNPNAFTQGLEFEKLCNPPGNCTDVLWESTGA